ncbi:hypothetical protein PRNP1_003345 [Phytophthora ramorum]
MEAPKKTGFWTQHVDPSSGRAYYFNMTLGRSYWELPAELETQVKKPTLDALREWDPEAAERKYGAATQQAVGDDEIRRKREEALAKSRAEGEAQAASTKVSLDERMALAAQKRKATEVQNSNGGSRLPSSNNAESSNEYLELVRQLQQHDDGEEGAGGKWLVR